MDHDTKAILAVIVVDKREVDYKSTNMEMLGLQRALADLQTAGLRVSELVTDAHVQIASMLSEFTFLLFGREE